MTGLATSEMKTLSPIERELSIMVPGGLSAKELDKAYQRLSSRVRIKGFRPGHAPRSILEQYYKNEVQKEVFEKVIDNSYRQAVQEHALKPVAEPNLENVSQFKPGTDLTYTAKVQIFPDIVLKNWKGLDLKVPEFQVSDADVMRELERIRAQQASVSPVTDRTQIQQGDLVDADIMATSEGHVAGELSENGKSIEVGSKGYFVEAEQALVGKNVGEVVDVSLTLPENFQLEAFGGKSVQLAITPRAIKVRQLPQLDDEFAKDVSENFASLEDLKKAISDMLTKRAEKNNADSLQETTVTALIANNPFDVPSKLVDKQAEHSAARLLSQFKEDQAKKLWEAHGERLIENARPQALRIVQASFILDAIAREDNLAVTDEDLAETLQKDAQEMGVTVQRLRSHYQQKDEMANLKTRILSQKAMMHAVSFANVTKEPKPLMGE